MTKRLFAAVLVPVSLLVGQGVLAQRGPGGPMRIVLLVDSSFAMSSMVTEFRAALNNFLDALPGDPEIVIISTGGQLRIRVGPTSDRQKLHAAASGFASDGGANSFLDTLLEADKRFLKNAPDRRSVFVILATDMDAIGRDVRIDVYNKFADDFLARGGRAHAVIVKGLNFGVTTQIAENLVNSTGGFYETVTIASAIPNLMKTLTDYVAADQ